MFVQETLVKMASTKLANARYLQCNLQLDRRVETALLAYIQQYFSILLVIFFFIVVLAYLAHTEHSMLMKSLALTSLRFFLLYQIYTAFSKWAPFPSLGSFFSLNINSIFVVMRERKKYQERRSNIWLNTTNWRLLNEYLRRALCWTHSTRKRAQ